ncbi:UDP-glucuronosyltransferase [Bacillus sp. V3-13]|nr:UDP-glucuronosyltransferase [Bacillus sp. V3-13]
MFFVKKVLLLPFLQISSGHHQVADAIAAYLKKADPFMQCKTVDLFHYTSKRLEKMTSALYLWAIKMLPDFYSKIYIRNAYLNDKPDQSFLFYEKLFLKSMKKLLSEENPDIVICTHCLPSYLLNVLKNNGEFTGFVVNSYTDFFINTVWGIKNIDLHIVPSVTHKRFLVEKQIDAARVIVTGIPVHPTFIGQVPDRKRRATFNILITGGNLGVGSIGDLCGKLIPSQKMKYFVLCGKNKTLFQKLKKLASPSVVPLEYIESREQMNRLYDEMDLVVTKPGGVTISECLVKKLPIILLRALPGQEEINEAFLRENKLVLELPSGLMIKSMEEEIIAFLENDHLRNQHRETVTAFLEKYEDFNRVVEYLYKR